MTPDIRRQGIEDAKLVLQELLDDPRLQGLTIGQLDIDRHRLENAWNALDFAVSELGARQGPRTRLPCPGSQGRFTSGPN